MHWFLNKLNIYGENIALADQNSFYTYKDLVQQAEGYYLDIAKFIKPTQVVAILSDYSYYSIALFLALMRHQCVLVPIVSRVEEEIRERLNESYADWVLRLDKGGRLTSENLSLNSQPDNIITQLQHKQHAGLILFSSGSTGKPKAMVHDLDNLIEIYRGRKPKKLSIIIFLMLDHIGGLNTLLNSLAMGAKIVIPKSREPDKVSQLIEQHQVNILPVSPTFLNLMLMSQTHERYNLKSLKMITYGTEAMPASLLQRLKTIFPKVRFLQTFGTSETGIVRTKSRSSASLDIKLDDPNQEYKIVKGELWLRSKTQVLGYLNAPMDSFTDGWFKTGDLVEEMGDGYLKIIGRNKEVINVGGEKVMPAEVESILLEMDEIEDCIVYGEKNIIAGQTVVADVVLKNGVDFKTIKWTIRKYCQKKIENYKIPTKIIVTQKTNFSERFKKLRLK